MTETDIRALYEALGAQMRAVRNRRDLTQEDLSARLHMARTSVTSMERGNQFVTVHVLMEWAAALGTKASDVLRDLELQRLDQAPSVAPGDDLGQSEAEFLRRMRLRVSESANREVGSDGAQE